MTLQTRPMIFRPLLPALVGALLTCTLVSSCATRMPAGERERRIGVYTETCGSYLSISDWERAQDQAMKGLSLDEDNFTLRLYLGRALLQRGDIDSISKSIYTLEELDPDGDFRVPLSLGAAFERRGLARLEAAENVESGVQYTDAPDPLARAEELREDSVEDFEQSLEQFKVALELQPTDTEILNGLVRITALRGEFLDSLAWCKAIVSITESDRVFWQARRARTDITPQDERRMMKNIIRLHNLEMAIHLHAASILRIHLQRPEEALVELDMIVAFNPKEANIHSQRGQLLEELGRYEEAIAALDTYLSLTVRNVGHSDVQRAFKLKRTCEAQLASAN